jgi:hypothetical protein
MAEGRCSAGQDDYRGKGDATLLRLSPGAVRHRGDEQQPARRPPQERHRACVSARPDRTQDARGACEVSQCHSALPGDGDAAQDPGDLPQRGDVRRGGPALHGLPHPDWPCGGVGSRSGGRDGRHNPAPDAGRGPARRAGTRHGHSPRSPLGASERDLRRGPVPRQRDECRLYARNPRGGLERGRAGDRQALPWLWRDRRRPEHGGDCNRRASSTTSMPARSRLPSGSPGSGR